MADIFDGAMGLIPIHTPLEGQTTSIVVTSGVTVYPGQVVLLTAGLVANFTVTGVGPCLGVSMDYVVGDGVLEATVCTDPDMIYKVKGNDSFAQANVGQFCDILADTVSTKTLRSIAVADTAAASGTLSTQRILTIVGDYQVVASGDDQWFEVRINALQLDA